MSKREQLIQDIIEDMPYGIDYWAIVEYLENGSVKVYDKYEEEVYTLTKNDISQAMIDISNDNTIEINSTIRNEIIEDNKENEMAMMDATSIDVVIQVAIFGEIVYG